jgi:protoporphyrinogen/coproporphyrinogen III oxidase
MQSVVPIPASFSSTEKPKFAVVGAGISGLTTAWYLERLLPHAQVDVYESTHQVGGVIRTSYSDPFLAELGADNFATLVPDALRMVDEMGIREQFIGPKTDNRLAQIVRNGKVLPIPNGFSLMQPTQLSSILSTPVLSLVGRLRVLAEFFVKQRVSSDDESVESFAVRRLGRECFDRLVEPIVGGIFTSRAETLSMQAAMPQFAAMEREFGGLIRGAIAKRKSQSTAERSARQATGARYDQFLAPKQGMSWWLDRIAKSLRNPVQFNTRVEQLCKASPPTTWTLQTRCSSNGTESSELKSGYHAVCLALPSPRSAVLLKRSHSAISEQLERIPYASSAVALLAIQRSEIRPSAFCFGVVVPKIEHRDCLAISLASEKYEGRCPSELVLVRVFMGGAIRPELMDKSDDELLGIARKEVKELLGVGSLPRWQSLVRWNEAMPQYLVGHTNLIGSIRKSLDQDPSIRLVGNAFDGVGIPQCVRLARQAAEHFAFQFQSKP